MGEASTKLGTELEAWPHSCVKVAEKTLGPWALSQVREEARAALSRIGLPSSSSEEWKYTAIDPLFRRKVEAVAPALGIQLKASEVGSHLFDNVEGAKIVFVDGRFDPTLSDLEKVPSGMTVQRSSEFRGEAAPDLSNLVGRSKAHTRNALAALNLGLAPDVVLVRVAENTTIENPLKIIHIATGCADGKVISPRLAVDALQGSSASLIEVFVGLGDGAYVVNSAAEVMVRANAIFNVHRIQVESGRATHLSHTVIEKEEGASGNLYLYSFGGALVRNDVEVLFKGVNGSGTVNGLTVLAGEQHVDNATVIEHAVPHCESSELFKGIYSDQSRGVFGGTIIVRPDAQKTNAYQSNQTLLLSDRAAIDTRPQLKIWADDVKCTHGATIGQLDRKALMYLRARGIDAATAKQFLVHAFASQLTTAIPWPSVREYIERMISLKLGEDPIE